MNTFFPGVQIGADDGTPLTFRLDAHATSAGLTFLDFELGGRPLTTHVRHTDGAMFARAVDLRGGMTVGRDEVNASAPYVIHPGLRSHYERAHAQVVSLPAAAYADHLNARGGRNAGGTFRFTGTAPRTPELGRYWTSVMSTAEAAFHSGADRALLPMRSLHDLVLRSSLTCFEHTWHDRDAERSHPHPITLRRALAYIDAHAHEPITVTDIAAAATLSVRGVQLVFQRDLGMTPLGYLKKVRLDGARRDLLAADPTTGATVVGVALRWGFSNPSRFAAMYREAYGETPSTTLRH